MMTYHHASAHGNHGQRSQAVGYVLTERGAHKVCVIAQAIDQLTGAFGIKPGSLLHQN